MPWPESHGTAGTVPIERDLYRGYGSENFSSPYVGKRKFSRLTSVRDKSSRFFNSLWKIEESRKLCPTFAEVIGVSSAFVCVDLHVVYLNVKPLALNDVPRQEIFCPNILSISKYATQAKQTTSWLLLNHFYPVISRVQKEKKATNLLYTLVMVRATSCQCKKSKRSFVCT